MGRHRSLVAGLVALTLTAGSAALAAEGHGRGHHRGRPQPPVGSTLHQIGHAGRWLTLSDGRVVVLHGLNMVAKLPPYDPAAIGFGADDAQFLEDHGFTTVRLGVIWKRLEPRPGQFDDSYLASLATTVQTLGEHGIYTLLDMHQDMWNEKFQGEGAPDWAVVDDGLPPDPPAGFPGNYFAMPALWRAFDHFWNNDATASGLRLQDAYAGAWRHVASYFAADPDVLGYDLLNEPFPGSQWYSCLSPAGCPVFDKQFLAPFVTKVLAAVRTVDRNHLVWYEPQLSFDFSAATSIGDPGDSHSGFAFHAYCAAAVGAPETPPTRAACDQVEDRTFTNAENQSKTSGDALLLTEFGATDDLSELQSMVDRADAHMVPWQEWTYVGGDPSAPKPQESLVVDPRKPPTGDNVRWAKLAVLERPYPEVVAGTPLSWSYDATKRIFKLTFSTTGPAGDLSSPYSLVYVPSLHYPHGYRVEVTGAQVVGSDGRPEAAGHTGDLALQNDEGATQVSVVIRPA